MKVLMEWQKREYSLNYKCSFPESWLGLEKEELKEKGKLAKEYVLKEKNNRMQAKRIIDFWR